MLSWRDGERRRAGHTLVELMTSLALLTVVVGALVTVLARQARFHAAAAQIIDTRGSVHEATEVLSAELRGLSPATGDVYAMDATSIEFRGGRGASVVCSIGPSDRGAVTLPPAVAGGAPLTAWHPAPDVGDSVLVYDPGPSPSAADDAWRAYALTAAPRSGRCAMSTGFTTAPAEESRGFTMQLDRPLAASIPAGSAMRFFRRTRYALYQGGDGAWYLGSLDCIASRTPTCSTIQPVSGPFEPPRPAATSGLAFTYFDAAGRQTADPRAVVRVGIIVRARSRDALRANGTTWSVFRDSAMVSVTVRN